MLAMMKIQDSNQLSPSLRVSDCWPYVRMDVLFMAVSARESGERRRSAGVGGMTQTSETVSMMNCVLVRKTGDLR